MKKKYQKFFKKDESSNIVVRQIVHEEEFELTEETLDRMERNSNVQIENARRLILEMEEKLEEVKKLRKLLK